MILTLNRWLINNITKEMKKEVKKEGTCYCSRQGESYQLNPFSPVTNSIGAAKTISADNKNSAGICKYVRWLQGGSVSGYSDAMSTMTTAVKVEVFNLAASPWAGTGDKWDTFFYEKWIRHRRPWTTWICTCCYSSS
jgi:hypothetical protein